MVEFKVDVWDWMHSHVLMEDRTSTLLNRFVTTNLNQISAQITSKSGGEFAQLNHQEP